MVVDPAEFGESNYAVTQGAIVLKKGMLLEDGNMVIEDDHIVEHSENRENFLHSTVEEQTNYMDFLGIDNHYFYGADYSRGKLLHTHDVEILATCLRLID